MKEILGFRARGRKIICADDSFEVREVITPYRKVDDRWENETGLVCDLLPSMKMLKIANSLMMATG
jgi:hypothetical protein